MSKIAAGSRYVPKPWILQLDSTGKVIKGFTPYAKPLAEPTTPFQVDPATFAVEGIKSSDFICSKKTKTIKDVLIELNAMKKDSFSAQELGKVFGYDLNQPLSSRLLQPAYNLLGILAKSGRVCSKNSATADKKSSLVTGANVQRSAPML